MRFPSPTPRLAVAHSPTPSIVRMAAFSNGEGKNALAAWDSWCSVKTTGPSHPRASPMSSRIHSFFLSQTGMAFMKDEMPRGAKRR